MKQDIRKSELLISGNFTEKELREFEQTLSDKNIGVTKYFIKTFEAEEVVRVFFRDFNAYQFLRDGILFELLMFGFTKAVSWVKGKKPKARVSTGAELRFKTRKGEIPVNIGIPTDNDKFWPQLEKTLTLDYLDSLENGEIINIYWDVKQDKISITKMKI